MKPANKLTPAESVRFKELDTIVTKGIKSFQEVGNALLEISDSLLYRETHSTFEEFVEDRYQTAVQRAYQLCEAAEVCNSLPKKCLPMVDNERQARALAKAPAADRPKVLKSVSRKGPVTAKAIKEETLRITRNSDDEALEEAMVRFKQNPCVKQPEPACQAAGRVTPEAATRDDFNGTMTEADLPSICKDLRDIADELEAFPDYGDIANRLVLLAKWVRKIGNIQ